MTSKEYRSMAWNSLQGNWGIAIVAFLIVGLITSATSVIPGASLIIYGLTSVGMCAVLLPLIRGEGTRIENIMDGVKYGFVNNLLAGILHSIFIALWSLLFVVPGLIKSYAYAMSFFLLRDDPNLSAMDAIKESQRMMDGHKMELFMLDVSFIGWYLLSLLTFGILLFWVEPYHLAARAAFYERLKNQQF